METINNLKTVDINAALLRLKRDIDKTNKLLENIANNPSSVENAIETCLVISKQLDVYKYIIQQLMNVAEKWSNEKQSTVFYRVLNNQMDSCVWCNRATQGHCITWYYDHAFALNEPVVDYGFCNDCQSLFKTTKEVKLQECSVCQGCNNENTNNVNQATCYHCYTSCEGCVECQNGDTTGIGEYCYQNQMGVGCYDNY